jgi:phosphatidylserine/phosphatidylglycerophosphate/cardiolipin synthase-like enzyme
MIIHDCHSLADDMHDIVREFPNHATARQRGNIDQETVVEFGTHRENEPDRVALDLLARTPSDSVIRLCSPYLNLSRDLLHALSKFAHVEIIAGSANANGFYKSKGLSGLIPEAYEILKEDIGNQISLFEYSRSGWTFHTKGIWISPATCEMPHSTIIGSHFRDTEISFAVKSSNPGVQESMRAELDDVLKYVRRSSPGQVKTPLLRYLVKGPLKTFL